MTNICRYSIVRFRPFAETGEFANVGIVAIASDGSAFEYQLTPKRFRRVTQFFDDLNGRLYSAAIEMLGDELIRISQARTHQDTLLLFDMATLKRESMFVFSDIRTARFSESLRDFVTKLFERYVRRDFVGPKQHEYLMEREIRGYLRSINVTDFRKAQIDDELMPVTFPFVSSTNGTYVIKPIAFDQGAPLDILDHEARWRNRLEHLIERGRLSPKNILLQIEGPQAENLGHLREAYRLAKEELSQIDVVMADRGDVNALRDFALRAAKSLTFLN